MYLQQRINLLVELREYMLSDDPGWQTAKDLAFMENPWFIPEFINEAIKNIVTSYLEPGLLKDWASQYALADECPNPKNLGLIMAGNIPLVGFHDFLTVFISGHRQTIKPSTKDSVLIRHLVAKLNLLDPQTLQLTGFAELMKGCDAYIATGSNNSARYFDYYLGKYPRLIRRNRSSAAILNGNESENELEGLADDICLYFGLGCRNVSKIYTPFGYDFIPLLKAFAKYGWQAEHHKYRNNYDYQLAVLLLNKQFYMTNGSLLLTQGNSLSSPISVLNFEYYQAEDDVLRVLAGEEALQCIIGRNQTPFGKAQSPGLTDYADGVDTLQFLLSC
jgi:hypothetical protein